MAAKFDPSTHKIAFAASSAPEAQAALSRLKERYEYVPIPQADLIVALGGDGFMLDTLHKLLRRKVPVYGMNRGTVGFLMNAFDEERLLERLARAERFVLNPLKMEARTLDGEFVSAPAINEVSLLRETRQAAKIEIAIDGHIRMPELICDGVLVATPAGSSAYNLSAHGPILPLGCNLLALTPISAFRPRRWRGAVLPNSAKVTFRVLEASKRPVSAVADQIEVRDVETVSVMSDPTLSLDLLFDPGHTLADRILMEQFIA
jgi:NAD+ kinase